MKKSYVKQPVFEIKFLHISAGSEPLHRVSVVKSKGFSEFSLSFYPSPVRQRFYRGTELFGSKDF